MTNLYNIHTFYEIIANDTVFYGEVFKRAALCNTLLMTTSKQQI